MNSFQNPLIAMKNIFCRTGNNEYALNRLNSYLNDKYALNMLSVPAIFTFICSINNAVSPFLCYADLRLIASLASSFSSTVRTESRCLRH